MSGVLVVTAVSVMVMMRMTLRLDVVLSIARDILFGMFGIPRLGGRRTAVRMFVMAMMVIVMSHRRVFDSSRECVTGYCALQSPIRKVVSSMQRYRSGRPYGEDPAR